MFGSFSGNDDFIRKIVRMFAEEFVSELKVRGFFSEWSDLLDVEETASVLGITREKLMEMIKEGTSPRVYRHSFLGYRFEPEDVRRWMERKLTLAILQEEVRNKELRESRAAEALGIKPYFLAELRKAGEGPAFSRTSKGAAIVYTYDSLLSWIDTRLSEAESSVRKVQESEL